MDFEGVLRDINAVISSAWPEIPPMNATPRQRYTSIQALRLSFVEAVRADEIALPCVVVDLGSDQYDPDWGVAGTTRRARLTVYYVGPESMPQPQIHAKLVALMNTMEAMDLSGAITHFEAPEGYPNIDSGPDSDVNRALVGESAVRVSAGHIEWMPGLLV